ncbi:hypothetical protein POSPLADRAFT_1038932 [Postia placenta MAD-698-R-SB12]|uniref:Uncharacterized protein n=1 Tax=Postia placenta MAD-698-R-SB12 TaxID=670580 RepID=A0A1X6N8Y7_9APHY|nr:hypothetical protein POSPLADRAFT_1038932 [Postia placenta MAD-698-R-SB12]OSX65097.1 hypothetical protein POSPLADRAFT_1038932 [Postia placenta MAD-698-R-SB12]
MMVWSSAFVCGALPVGVLAFSGILVSDATYPLNAVLLEGVGPEVYENAQQIKSCPSRIEDVFIGIYGTDGNMINTLHRVHYVAFYPGHCAADAFAKAPDIDVSHYL